MTSSKNNRWNIVFGGFVPGELVVGFTLSSISALMFKISSDLSLTEFVNADIVFATGTNGEMTPVHEIDSRKIEGRNCSW